MRIVTLMIGLCFLLSSLVLSADAFAQMPKFSMGLENDDGKRGWERDPTVKELDRKPIKGFQMKLDGGSEAEKRMVDDNLGRDRKSDIGSEANIKKPEDMGGSHVKDTWRK